jgi:hypothetical protein
LPDVSIRRDLERPTVNVANVVGYPKETDYALERIAAIEKHLGINKKIDAKAAAGAPVRELRRRAAHPRKLRNVRTQPQLPRLARA